MTVVPVTFVSSHSRLGGAERYLVMLLEGLGREWVRDVVCLEPGPFVERLQASGYPTTVIPASARAPGIVAAAWKLRRRLRQAQPAVVHANGIKAALVAALATLGSPTPIVWVKHDFSWDGSLTRLVARRCERVIGVSRAVLQTFGPGLSGRTEVIHNGIAALPADRGAGRRRLEEALGAPLAGSPVVALVGRLDSRKGHRELIAAAPDVLERQPGTQFVFIGGDDPVESGYGAALRREVAGAGLPVTFLGYRDDVIELISGSSALAIPSVPDARGVGREGFPYVGLEALAVGTPIVGYVGGGLSELIGDCGVLVASGDRAALADAIIRIVTEDGFGASLAACGSRRVVDEFSLPRMIDAMQERYRAAAKVPR